ncbi:7922_t:CDS:1, partial [Racocetra fulgida]
HLQFLFDYITEKEPNIAIYEHTNYLNLKGKDMTALFKLFGGIEGLKLNFACLNSIESIPVNQ